VPATRLLVVADSKILPALADGLREGARFDVATASLTDPVAAQTAAADAEAVALFYGGPVAVQALAAKLRERGGRVVAVLQREQLAQRDDCFRAGASELLFMPMPKDQFVSRLAQACELSFETASGAAADVSVATRTTTLRLAGAQVTGVGIEAAGDLPFKVGETVRLTFASFQAWGLVARPAGPARIRFAGMTPDEEGQLRKWLDAGAPASGLQAAPSEAAQAAPSEAAQAAPSEAAQAADAPLTPPPGATVPPAGAPLVTPPESTGVDGARAAPAKGPPPGFADRRPVRASSRPVPVRGPPPILTPPSTPKAAPAPAPTPDFPPQVAASEGPAAVNGDAALSNLFDDGAATTPPGATPTAPAPQGPLWPTVYSPQSCKTAALFLLQDKNASPDGPSAVVASARKVTGALSAVDRESLQKAGSDSSFADALVARIALGAAIAEGATLYAAVPAPFVEASAAAGLVKQADEAGTRLQKEANSAVAKGEVESLQLITAASAALSRDLLSFKETADRLKGLAAAPRLGAGALDPHVAIPGQPQRAVAGKPQEKQQVRAELRDFKSLEGLKSGTWPKIFLGIGSVLFLALAVNGFYFSMPHLRPISEDAGKNVQSIQAHADTALVIVNQEWIDNAQTESLKLIDVLRERGIKKALLVQVNGRPAGMLDVQSGRILGLPASSKPKK
jgi:hypothetical protein